MIIIYFLNLACGGGMYCNVCVLILSIQIKKVYVISGTNLKLLGPYRVIFEHPI